ncbi:DUF4326 domain-containing protein [Cupriavidus taiwanensis]|uniref:DUF4326 domain-containing protein n=1 Tax=Cupriavidus taiwanensis TaxID=164546 RepID=UPI0015F29983|nr:DUF4326 domain-containing protein [Cupriavidus taiwanensis]
MIAISQGFSDEGFFSSAVSETLREGSDLEIVVVNDRGGIADKYLARRGVSFKKRACKNKLEARAIARVANYAMVFWSGDDLSHLIFSLRKEKVPLRIYPFEITTVVNVDSGQEFDVYIGRKGPWGNPFPIIPGTSETRDVVIQKYEKYFHEEILGNSDRKKMLLGLRGLRLGCHCKPAACHGDVIANYLNNYADPDQQEE